MVFTSYVTQSQEVFQGVHFLTKRHLQGRVSGQVTPSTEPEVPVLSFHDLLSWHLGNAGRQNAANGGWQGCSCQQGTSLGRACAGAQYSFSLGHCLLTVLVS